MPAVDHSMITELRALARETRALAYTGMSDKEHALLRLSNQLDEHARRLEATVLLGGGKDG